MSDRENSTSNDIIRNDLPTLYVDGISASHRNDGVNYVSLTADIPGYIVEQVRCIIDDKHLPGIIDRLCQLLDYFPEKPSKRPRRPKE